MNYLGDYLAESNEPTTHKIRQLRNEREYNEWRRETYPRYLLRRREGVLRRVLHRLPKHTTLRRILPKRKRLSASR